MNPNLDLFHSLQYYWISSDWLKNRMLFLSGPRQVGKTTLVTSKLTKNDGYFNWDNRKIRTAYQDDPDFFIHSQSEWICFDEIHKRPKWKDILKGIYDTHKNQFRFVVTGSARLDTFKKSGDSLVGRYFHTHLFPFNLGDFTKQDFSFPISAKKLLDKACDTKEMKILDDLLKLGGFPEPLFSSSENFWKRWSAQHDDLILTEDLRDLSHITEVDKIERLLTLLKPTIGSTLSYRNLASDLETTHGSIKRWLTMLERVELVFSISPYSKKINRAFKQEKKWFYTDWRASKNNSFENYIACSLFRMVTLYKDRFGENMSLHFVRTHDGAEIDFLICKDNDPWLLVEAKEGKPDISSAVHRFTNELKVPCAIVTPKPNYCQKIKGSAIYALSWSKLGGLLP